MASDNKSDSRPVVVTVPVSAPVTLLNKLPERKDDPGRLVYVSLFDPADSKGKKFKILTFTPGEAKEVSAADMAVILGDEATSRHVAEHLVKV